MTAPAAPSLPIIDLTPFLSPHTSTRTSKLATSAALHAACATHGFFYLLSPLPPTLSTHVLSQARTFFLSPPSTKSSISRPPNTARGYQTLGENVTQGHRDHHEAIDFYRESPAATGVLAGENRWPQQEGFREAFEEFWGRLGEVGEALMVAMAWALGYENEENVLVKETTGGFWVARVIGYPPLAEEGGEGVSCGVHTDYGCTTFLLADEAVGALQVLGKGGEWINADPVPGCMVVNIGDMLEIWTNGLWKSTKHRVVHRAEKLRVSVPFFYEPRLESVVRPLEKCVVATGGVVRYPETVYGVHLMKKVGGNFYGGGEEK